MGRISREARLCFILLWTIVDDAGRARASSRMLASLLYPYDDDAPRKIGGWLDELQRAGCVRRYEVDGNQYLDLPNWLKHQKIDHASQSRLPPFREVSRELASIPESLAPDLGPRTMDLGPSISLTSFAEWFSICPKKVGRKKALSIYQRVIAKGEATAEQLLEGMKRYARECAEKEPQFIAHPATWLNAGRWADEPSPTNGHTPPDEAKIWKSRAEMVRKGFAVPLDQVVECLRRGLITDEQAKAST